MATPINNPLNALNALTTQNSGTPASRQSGASSDTQFNQLLSRGVEERNRSATRQNEARHNETRTPEPAKPAPKENAPAKQTTQAASSSQSAAKTGQADAPEADKTASAQEDANAVPAQEPATASLEEGKATAGADETDEGDEAALAANSDELLALVANMMQAATSTTSAASPTSSTTSAPTADEAQDGVARTAHTIADADKAAASMLASTAASTADPAVATLATDSGEADPTAQATLDMLRNRTSAESATSNDADAARSFDASLAHAKAGKQAGDAQAATQQPVSSELANPAPSVTEAQTSRPAVDTQLAAAPATAVNMQAVPQVALQQAQAAAAAASDRIAPRVGNPGWDQAVGQKVVWMVAGEQQSASLTLNPPDLGPLQVVVNVSNSQATVHFTSAQAEVRQALENAVPKLREMLGDAGIQLGQANVGAGTPDSRQSAFDNGRNGRVSGRGASSASDDNGAEPVRIVRTQTITGGGNGLVDTFA